MNYKELPVYIEDLEYIDRTPAKECDFVIYRNDLPICMGDIHQCAKFLGVNTSRILKLTSALERDRKIAEGKPYTFAQKVPKHLIAFELGIGLEEYEEECKKYLSCSMF